MFRLRFGFCIVLTLAPFFFVTEVFRGDSILDYHAHDWFSCDTMMAGLASRVNDCWEVVTFVNHQYDFHFVSLCACVRRGIADRMDMCRRVNLASLSLTFRALGCGHLQAQVIYVSVCRGMTF